MAEDTLAISNPSSSQPQTKKVRFEAWITPQNHDFLYAMSRADRRSMSNMMDEILCRLRVHSSAQHSQKEKAPSAVHA